MLILFVVFFSVKENFFELYNFLQLSELYSCVQNFGQTFFSLLDFSKME